MFFNKDLFKHVIDGIDITPEAVAEALAHSDNEVQAAFFNSFQSALYHACGDSMMKLGMQLLHVVPLLTPECESFHGYLCRAIEQGYWDKFANNPKAQA